MTQIGWPVVDGDREDRWLVSSDAGSVTQDFGEHQHRIVVEAISAPGGTETPSRTTPAPSGR